MFITPLNKIDSVQQLGQINAGNTINTEKSQSDFRSIFSEAVSNVVETEDNLAKEQYLFATGQSQDTHSLGIASSKAQISVDLLVTLRNKALDSYNELMRINL